MPKKQSVVVAKDLFIKHLSGCLKSKGLDSYKEYHEMNDNEKESCFESFDLFMKSFMETFNLEFTKDEENESLYIKRRNTRGRPPGRFGSYKKSEKQQGREKRRAAYLKKKEGFIATKEKEDEREIVIDNEVIEDVFITCPTCGVHSLQGHIEGDKYRCTTCKSINTV